MDKVVKTVCFLADIADFAAFNKVYEKFFTSCPARSCVAVKDIPKGALCEIEMHCGKPEQSKLVAAAIPEVSRPHFISVKKFVKLVFSSETSPEIFQIVGDKIFRPVLYIYHKG